MLHYSIAAACFQLGICLPSLFGAFQGKNQGLKTLSYIGNRGEEEHKHVDVNHEKY